MPAVSAERRSPGRGRRRIAQAHAQFLAQAAVVQPPRLGEKTHLQRRQRARCIGARQARRTLQAERIGDGIEVLAHRELAVVADVIDALRHCAKQGRHAGLRQIVGMDVVGVDVVGRREQRRAAAHTFARVAADAVLHLAPPPGQGDTDPRTVHLLHALARHARVRRIVYASTSGVYGDCAGARFDETRAVDPATDRARRRVDAEQRLRRHGRDFGVAVTLLRIPGIYAADRAGGHPRERLLRGTPVLAAADDVYTNHIHADDLARACVAALHRGAPQRIYHASDDTELKMGDYFDLAADLCGLPRPRRIGLEQARAELSPMQLSFMGESRRLSNARLKRELRLRLRYPTVSQGLLA